jgi:Rrf2 family transcriptional regulator, iron-sulfur cluster assembly transcription factor
MMLTTNGRYAVMAILEVASIAAQNPITLSGVSASLHIPQNYLEQIFAKLKKAGLVKSIRGPGGGYVITTDLTRISIANIIDAVGENIKMTRCSEHHIATCTPGKVKCKTHHLWQGLEDNIRKYFETISLADVLAGEVS